MTKSKDTKQPEIEMFTCPDYKSQCQRSKAFKNVNTAVS